MVTMLPVRKYIFLSLLAVTPTGFLFKCYSGPAQWWFNDYGAGLLYEIFWCLVVFLWIPRRDRTTHIAVGVFGATGLLETLQLWHPWVLEQIRSTFLGRALIGTTFVGWDFPHYLLGCLIAWCWMRRVSVHRPSGSVPLERC